VALFCGCLLLASIAQAARTHYNASVEGGERAVDLVGMVTAGAQLDVVGGDAELEGRTNAIALVKSLWMHTQVLLCLEDNMEVSADNLADVLADFFQRNKEERKQKLQETVKQIWEVEFNQATRKVLKEPRIASIKNKILGFLKLGGNNQPQLPQKEPPGEKLRLAKQKSLLQSEYRFDYDAVKRQCMLNYEARFERTAEMAGKELSDGCQGGCSKWSAFVDNQCRETSATFFTSFCPEGTRCGCDFELNEMLGMAVSATLVSASAVTAVGRNLSMLAVPGGMGAGVLAAFLSSKEPEGCSCLPSPCAWDKERGACTPAPASGAKNPYQAILPYVGTKCLAKPAGDDSSKARECEKLQPCAPGDGVRIGQKDADTFNCQHNWEKDAVLLFPPLRERMAFYRKIFPPEPEFAVNEGMRDRFNSLATDLGYGSSFVK